MEESQFPEEDASLSFEGSEKPQAISKSRPQKLPNGFFGEISLRASPFRMNSRACS